MLAGLIACSVLDIQYYLIDLRIVYVVVAVGLVGWMTGLRQDPHAVWLAAGPYYLAATLGVVAGEEWETLIASALARDIGSRPGYL